MAGRLYVQVSARGLYAGTGMYQPSREELGRFRNAIAEDDELEQILERARLDVEGASLKTAPRGYPRDHPRIELLRRKQLIVGKALPGDGGIARDPALALVRGVKQASAPLLEWLDARVYGSG